MENDGAKKRAKGEKARLSDSKRSFSGPPGRSAARTEAQVKNRANACLLKWIDYCSFVLQDKQ